MKDHLAGTKKNVRECDRVPPDVRQEMADFLKNKNFEKDVARRKSEEHIESGAYFTSSKDGSSMGSTARGIRGPMDRFLVDLDDEGCDDQPKPKTEKEARDEACLDIGRFFFENGLPFHVANSPSFISMVRAIGKYGRGLKPPTAYELSTWILDEEERRAKIVVDEVKKTWMQTGVSILSDGWKDIRGRHLINFLVNNPHGTVFLRSVDASDAIKDANMLFKLLDSVVEEVGEELVIQVVTDNASNYKAAGKLLMEKRKRLWWTPCAAHCIDLMLEKVGELPQHKNALIKSKKVLIHL